MNLDKDQPGKDVSVTGTQTTGWHGILYLLRVTRFNSYPRNV